MNQKIYPEPVSVGYVVLIRDFLVKVSGLDGVKIRESVRFKNGAIGEVFTILEDSVDILLIDGSDVLLGEEVYSDGREIGIIIPDTLSGSILDPLGNIRFSNKTTSSKERVPFMTHPQGIFTRSSITEPLETGVSIVDVTTPLGKGQRELVLGDRKTGKTQFLFQVLKQQAQNGTFCIYAAIGKREVDVLELIDFINESKIQSNVCVVATTIADGLGKIFLTPYSAMTIAEHIRDQGTDVLVILDDLTSHAQFYREISLNAKRFPGRSAYPGNIFHLHSTLMERAGNFKVKDKSVSITCLPVAQSTFGDIAGYITTNLMSMTDGHIYLDTEIFDLGRRPAVNPFLSVTRVGHQTQAPLAREISREISSLLIEHKQAEDFSHFGSEASENVKQTLAKGNILYALFDQQPGTIVPMWLSYFLLAHLIAGSLKGLEPGSIKKIVLREVEKYISDKNYREQIITLMSKKANLKEYFSEIQKYPITND